MQPLAQGIRPEPRLGLQSLPNFGPDIGERVDCRFACGTRVEISAATAGDRRRGSFVRSSLSFPSSLPKRRAICPHRADAAVPLLDHP